jgi:hypothetical protein
MCVEIIKQIIDDFNFKSFKIIGVCNFFVDNVEYKNYCLAYQFDLVKCSDCSKKIKTSVYKLNKNEKTLVMDNIKDVDDLFNNKYMFLSVNKRKRFKSYLNFIKCNYLHFLSDNDIDKLKGLKEDLDIKKFKRIMQGTWH